MCYEAVLYDKGINDLKPALSIPSEDLNASLMRVYF
jgi:hypothetical protein